MYHYTQIAKLFLIYAFIFLAKVRLIELESTTIKFSFLGCRLVDLDKFMYLHIYLLVVGNIILTQILAIYLASGSQPS